MGAVYVIMGDNICLKGLKCWRFEVGNLHFLVDSEKISTFALEKLKSITDIWIIHL